MKTSLSHLDPVRRTHPLRGYGDSHNGFAVFERSDAPALITIFSRDKDWEHVSVSTPERCPTWEEMSMIKRIFWDDDEVCMQLHVEVENHVNNHPYCLHIWRPRRGMKIPRPPKEYV